MYSVEELIGNLLLRHNCVIVPSFGGFVAKQSSATIDYKNGVMLPPRKSVLFNRQLINSDGLLVSEFASTNEVFYPAAEQCVLGRVADWNEKLRNGERVTLDRVGYLFYDQEKNICFEQDRFFNLLLESYGLGKVHFITEEDIKIVQHISVEAPNLIAINDENVESTFKLVSIPLVDEVPFVVSKEDFVLIEHPVKKSPSKLWKYVAAAVLLPIGFYSFWLPMKTNVLESGVLSIKDFNPAYKALAGEYTQHKFKVLKPTKVTISLENSIKSLPSDVHIFSYALDDDTYVPVRISIGDDVQPLLDELPEISAEKPAIIEEVKKVEVKKVEVKKVVVKNVSVTNVAVVKVASKSFDYIVGSFTSEEAANIAIDKFKSQGLKAYLVKDSSGNHRVSAGSASTAEEIKSISEKSRAAGVEGWILKK